MDKSITQKELRNFLKYDEHFTAKLLIKAINEGYDGSVEYYRGKFNQARITRLILCDNVPIEKAVAKTSRADSLLQWHTLRRGGGGNDQQ